MEEIIPIIIVGMLFIGLPWIVFHYITKWKSAATLTLEDENLLDELHELARRLDDRMGTIERIMAAENPNWRALANEQNSYEIEHRSREVEERLQDRSTIRSNQSTRRIGQ